MEAFLELVQQPNGVIGMIGENVFVGNKCVLELVSMRIIAFNHKAKNFL